MIITFITGAMAQTNLGSGRGHYNNILCNGRETWLIDCQYESFTGSCRVLVGAQCSYNYLRRFIH
jgi:hypothetical protein